MFITDHFATLAPGYDAVLSEVWGVIHNGVAAFPAASEALSNFRAKGGAVVLISNAPRPGNQVVRMLDRLGVPHTAYDGIVTSADVTRDKVAGRASPRRRGPAPRGVRPPRPRRARARTAGGAGGGGAVLPDRTGARSFD